MRDAEDFAVEGVPAFSARGLRRCVVPGASCSIQGDALNPSTSVADFWCGRDGAVLMRITWMRYVWSIRVRKGNRVPMPDEMESMERLAFVVAQELHRWMTEDAADLPPFEA